MSDRNEEISATHQASAEAADSIRKSLQNTEEIQAMLLEERRREAELKNGLSSPGFFSNLLAGLRGEAPKVSDAPTSPAQSTNFESSTPPPPGLETFIQDPFAHLREARAARQEVMAPAMPSPGPVAPSSPGPSPG